MRVTAEEKKTRTIQELRAARDHGVRFKGYRVTIAPLLAAESRDELRHAQQLREFRQA